MIDMHCHILPNIDDGAENMETAIAMADMAVQKGTTGIVATPHVIEGDWLPDWEDIVDGCDSFNRVLKGKGMDLPIYPGAEVAMNMDILDMVDGPGRYCINGGRYMLVELPAAEIPSFADEFFFLLQTKGISPILAHPERHPVLTRQPEKLIDWIDKGILLQINGISLSGRMGHKVKDMAELLLTNNMVHFVGSDAHSTRTRNTDLSKASETISDLIDKSQMQTLFITNPSLLLTSQEIEIGQYSGNIKPCKQPGFFHKIFSLFK